MDQAPDGFLEIVWEKSGRRSWSASPRSSLQCRRKSGACAPSDLSLPKIRKRLDATEPQKSPRTTNPWHRATAAAESIPHRLEHAEDAAAQAHLAAFGEALDALPLRAPQTIRPQLRQAAEAFERATRVQAEHQHARALRGAVRAMIREPAPKDGALLAMFLDAAILAVIAAARWHQLRNHDQQVAAAHQTLIQLQPAYEHTAVAPLTALAQRRPPQQVVQRHILLIHQIMPGHAKQVVEDPSFDALTAVLADAEKAGHDPKQLLQRATDEQALDDARSPARVLTWRVERLSSRPVPSERARVARIRSATQWSVAPVRPTTDAPTSQPQPPQARRR